MYEIRGNKGGGVLTYSQVQWERLWLIRNPRIIKGNNMYGMILTFMKSNDLIGI